MAPNPILASLTDYFFSLNYDFLGNEAWRWLCLVGLVLGSLIIGKTASFFLDWQGKRLESGGRRRKVLGTFLRSFAGPVTMLMLSIGLYLSGMCMILKYENKERDLSFDLQSFWDQTTAMLAALAVGWFIYRLVDIAEIMLRKMTSRTRTMLDDQLVPLLRKTIRIIIVVVVILFIAQNVYNQDIGAIIAGLGIGGLAFALAARDMLANFFGSVTIFADRPFQMGERIKIKDYDGVIEEVGFRSTRLRTLDGHLVTVPNSMVTNEVVENIGRRPYIRRLFNVTVTYNTPPEKVQQAINIIREMLDARKASFDPANPARVYFSDFNADSLNIVVYYWFTPADWWQYLAFNNDFNMELLRRFNEAGIEFAFPTRTLYLKQDSPVSAEVELKNRQ